MWFTEWFSLATPATGSGLPYDGGNEGKFFTTKIQKITVTNLVSGLKSVWEFVGTPVSGSPQPQRRFYNGTPYDGDVYNWVIVWTNTLNEFGSIGSTSIPFGRYAVECTYHTNAAAVPVGTATKTNYFINRHGMNIHHGSFGFESKPIRNWEADWTFSNLLTVIEL